MRAGVPVLLSTVVSDENQSDYSVEIPMLFPGGTYHIKVQAWQNVSGESASSSVQEIKGTTSMCCEHACLPLLTLNYLNS